MTGQSISHYKILEKLGGGGMGVVYKAEDTKLRRFVALKFLPPDLTRDDEAKERFVHEAQTASALDHPNICTIHEIDETQDGQMFIAMAHYEGETLKKKLTGEQLSVNSVIDIAIQIAQGLAKAHEHGIVHRDIKPANIFVTRDGLVKILDFGLAKLIGVKGITRTGTTVGTAAYMSPEQAQGLEVDHRTDLWSLGVVLYEMVTGQLPFQGEYEQAVVYSLLNEDPKSVAALRSDIPIELEGIVDQALEKGREERLQSAGIFLEELRKIAGAIVIGKGAVPAKTSKQRQGIWKRVVIAAVAAAAVVGMLLFSPSFIENDTLVSSPKPIAVMPFENKTGDPSLDYLREVIPNLLITNLEKSRYFNPMTWERMQDLLRAAHKDHVEIVDLDKDLGFELCKTDGIRAIIVGSITKAGEVFAADLKVLDAGNKALLFGASSKGNGVSSILASQIDDLSKAIARGMVRAHQALQDEEFKVTEVTTRSLEAYRYFLAGVKDHHRFFHPAANANLEKALALDSSFAMAYYYLARSYLSMENRSAAKAAIEKAYAFSDRVSEREALYIRMQYATSVEGDAEKALRINKDLVEKYPKEKEAYLLLGLRYREAGKPLETIRAYEQALALDPNYAVVYNDLGYRYAWLGDFEKAEQAMQKYASLTRDEPNAFDSLGDLYFIMGRLDDAIVNFELTLEMAQPRNFWLSALVQLGYVYAIKEDYAKALLQYDNFFSLQLVPEFVCNGYWNKAILSLLLGRHQEALHLLREEVTVAERAKLDFRKAEALELMAFVYAEADNFVEAENALQVCLKSRLRAEPASSLRWKLQYNCLSAFFDLKNQKVPSAQEKLLDAKALSPQFKHLTAEIYSYWIALLEGETLLAERRFDEAIQAFLEVVPPNPYLRDWFNLYVYRLPVARDGLARAYYANGDFDKAIAEYRRLVTFDPSSKERFLIEPKHHYALARLCEEQDKTELAVQEYEKFLTIWKDADQSLPELADARTRLEELKTLAVK